MNRWQIPAARRRRARTRVPRVELTALGDRWPSYTTGTFVEFGGRATRPARSFVMPPVAPRFTEPIGGPEHGVSTADVAPVTMLRNFRRHLFGEPR